MDVFLELTSIVLIATFISIFMRIFRQPLVVGYIFTGIIVGPHVFDLMQTTEYIELFSHIGITILLFIVGLNLSPRIISEVGKVSFIGGMGQIGITALFGFIIARFIGQDMISSIYLALALTFSSTIIILKLLSDKGDLPKLYGRISLGLLLVQDLVAIVALLFVSSFAGTHSGDISQTLLLILLKSTALFALLFILSKYVFPRVVHYLATSQELLFLFSVTWGFGLASLFHLIGFSVEVGALVAGISLSVTPYADGIASRLKPLRDFFIILFFILLGSEMVLSTIPIIIVPALILTLFVIIFKPLIIFFLMNILGYKTKQGFQTGIALSQISEFSLILAALGVSVGHLGDETVSLITVTALLSIALSSYLITYSDVIYSKLEKILKKIEINPNPKKASYSSANHDLVLFGYDRVGRDFVEAFTKLERQYVIVDYNPTLIQQLQKSELPFKYGDVEDLEFLSELSLSKIKLCVSTIPNFKVSSLLVKKVREENKTAIIIVRARELDEARKLYEFGATYVVMPHYLGAKYATGMIARIGLDEKGFAEEREKHLKHISSSSRHP